MIAGDLSIRIFGETFFAAFLNDGYLVGCRKIKPYDMGLQGACQLNPGISGNGSDDCRIGLNNCQKQTLMENLRSQALRKDC